MGIRVKPPGRILFCVVVFLFLLYQYDAAYVRQRVREAAAAKKKHGADWDHISRMLVVVTTKKTLHEASWVHEELPDWPSTIYVADDPEAEHHPPANKGNEAMSYLDYIVRSYDTLPEVVVFAHHHNTAFHIDGALGTNANSIRRLNLTHVVARGYQALRCVREPHCVMRTPDVHNKATASYCEVWDYGFQDEDKGKKPRCPSLVLAPRFAQFAVSRDAIRSRPRRVYERLQRWLINRKPTAFLTDEIVSWSTGRLFEYMWHVLFGKPGMLCVDQDRCYCDAFGLCDDDPGRGWWPAEKDFPNTLINETIHDP